MFSGVVLAGGKSSRFGSDKARFVYQGKPMTQWVLESFVEADERFIVTNQSYTFNVPVYPDLLLNQTPLSGIHSALVHAKNDWVAVAACDMPFLTPAYWELLLPFCQNTKAVVVENQAKLEPLAAFYHKTLNSVIENRLQQNQKAVYAFLQTIQVRVLNVNDLDVSPRTFHNINSLEDILDF
jgi:molybdenum cofactor guanylyltransferase